MKRRFTMQLVVLLSVIAILICSGCSSKTCLWNGKDFSGWKLHVDDKKVDVHSVWSIKDGVIHCKGVPNGYIRTEKDYSNYKLHLEWRWAESEVKKPNSGVLLHTSGPDKIWPKCIEAQLMSENAGDFWLVAGTAVTVDGKRTVSPGKPTNVKKKQDHSEKPIGQWNTYDIYCKGDTIRLFVNGVLQNDATDTSDTSGKICLQSEGAPIEFRNIYIKPL